MSISRARRWRVFERDDFTCRYCGRKSPTVVLEADHVTPRSKGGTDHESNLVTACEDCNRGKSDRPLREPNAPPVAWELEREHRNVLTFYMLNEILSEIAFCGCSNGDIESLAEMDPHDVHTLASRFSRIDTSSMGLQDRWDAFMRSARACREASLREQAEVS